MSYTFTQTELGAGNIQIDVLWSVTAQNYILQSNLQFTQLVRTIFDVADSLAASSGSQLVSSDENPPVQGGVGNLWAEYGVGASVVGNARGVGAVDLQQNRALATQVASGVTATICGGAYNTASGDHAYNALPGSSSS